jgi:hypothetical protein
MINALHERLTCVKIRIPECETVSVVPTIRVQFADKSDRGEPFFPGDLDMMEEVLTLDDISG